MQNRMWGNEYRTTTVCVDSYENNVLAGRFYSLYRKEGESFQSLVQFLLKMEQTLDSMNFPQAFTSVRAFAPPPSQKSDASPIPELMKGALATFSVRVIFRQNTSWQGSVTWLESGTEQSFRSTLELILLIDSALSGTGYQPKGGPASP